MSFVRVPLLLAAAVSAASLAVGCAATDEDDHIVVGDGNSPEDEIVSERQLYGNELPDKTISLTFDDGPGARTEELADYLAARGIKATFFINGSKVAGRQSAVDRIVARGHLLANHTHNHKQLTKQSSATIIQEIADTDAIIADVQPAGPWVVRAPYGAWNGTVARTLNGSAMKKYVGSVFWDFGGELTSYSAADWDCWGKGVSVQRCGDLYLTEIRKKKRGIVLMHDIHNKTVDMVKAIVPVLEQEGFKFASLLDVPSVKRAIAASTNGDVDDGRSCSSATLGRTVAENVCVQSRSNSRWFRCVDGEWYSSTGPGDARCTQTFALP